MKIAFIADIHGNAVALDAVLEDLKEKNVDEIFVLGDICFRGPEPQRSLDLVRSMDTDVIKGNADEWVVRGVGKDEVPDDAFLSMNKERDWTVSQLDAGDMEYLNNLPHELNLEYGKIKIHVFHATPNSLFEMIQPAVSDAELSKRLIVNEADIYVYAHIHKPYIRYLNGRCIINTGSVGLPFDGLTHSAYALIEIKDEDIQTSIIRTKYNVEKVIDQFNNSDYPNKEFMVNLLRNGG